MTRRRTLPGTPARASPAASSPASDRRHETMWIGSLEASAMSAGEDEDGGSSTGTFRPVEPSAQGRRPLIGLRASVKFRLTFAMVALIVGATRQATPERPPIPEAGPL